MRETIVGLVGLAILFAILMKITKKKNPATSLKAPDKNVKFAFGVLYLLGVVGGFINHGDLLQIFLIPAFPAILAGIFVKSLSARKTKKSI